ncbi:MAG: TATA-box-binding protein [Candidatus Aenigmarchaeota archaeon]|nr:TATA-box-binding protein [Candidatus Aenigmarchaeota archaeon]
MEIINIHNVVASCHAGTQIPLNRLAMELERTEYEPEQFPGLVLRLDDPKSAALIFNTGKIVLTGTKSPEQAEVGVENLVKLIRTLGIDITEVKDMKIQNIVASANMNAKLNLNKIAFDLEGTEYEPAQFPGLVYRLDGPKTVFLLFSTGKVICTGGKSVEEVHQSVAKLRENLKAISAL